MVAALLLTTGSMAHAAPGVLKNEEARAHFQRAQEHFNEQNFPAAIPELKAAYALEPNPMLLYAWAQAERLAGSCERAVALYRRFLDTNPSDEQRRLTEANLLDCEAELPEPPPATEEPGVEEPGIEEPVEPIDDEPQRPWYTDTVGGVLAGSGVAGIIGGGVLMGVARNRANEAPNAAVEDDYLAQSAEAQRLNTAGVVVLGIGAVLAVGGAVRYALVARKSSSGDQAAKSARVTPLIGGTSIGVRLRF
ncbi:MAG: hypothetical protein AAF799_38360 [Myxococcota bacterium]